MSYYSYNFNNNYGDYHVRPSLFRGAIRVLLIANIAVFVISNLLGINHFVYTFLGLVPTAVIGKGFIWQFFTYMFVHGGLGHIFMNMFVLWMFGMELENYWGKKEFLKYYLITGVGSGIITYLFSLGSSVPVIGASGAIYALLLAFGMMFPDRRIYIYLLFPVKAKYFVMLLGVMTFISSLGPSTSGISHLTHLGGLIIGYFYFKRKPILDEIRLFFKRNRISNPFKNLIRKIEKKDQSTQTTKSGYETDETMREMVDMILDKISRSGYDSLTEQERKTLYLASKYFAEKQKKN
ncbi:MAG: rhomboid family intramembrane serine protease [Candidatus Marinimicrobia bacterium]|nr:rhomboid family intramembrane serine protease [Candidatus Neomarinimicrobiota bacterium]